MKFGTSWRETEGIDPTYKGVGCDKMADRLLDGKDSVIGSFSSTRKKKKPGIAGFLKKPHSAVTPYTCETEIPFGRQMSG